MTLEQAMTELKKRGTAQNIKVYKRHGAGDNLFGVSFANLRDIQKKIKQDQKLAEELWKTGNSDARTLALLIADPAEVSTKTLKSWMKDIKYYLLGDLLSGLVAKTNHAEALMGEWMKSELEFERQVGYDILAARLRDGDAISDADLKKRLAVIKKELLASPNRSRHAMNMAICAIGIYRPGLREQALSVADSIGKVEVDHGETSCKTPDARGYIEKAAAREKSRGKKK